MSLVDQVLQDVVHHGLEGGGGVGKAEEHDRWFEEPSVGTEGSLPLVSFLYSYVIVSPPNIQLGKDPGPLQLVDELLYQRQGVAILDRAFI